MIALLCLVGFGAFIVASTGVGARLLLLARRTGGTAELLLGVSLLLMGPFGQGLLVIGRELAPEPGSPLTWVLAAGLGSETLAAGVLYLFAWRIFRAHQASARWVFLFAVAVLATAGAVDVTSRAWVNVDGRGAAYWIAAIARTFALYWIAGESLAMHLRLRGRVRRGLAPAGAAVQSARWALGMAFGGAAGTLWLGVHWWTGRSPALLPSVNAMVSVLAFAGAIELWLAFRPTIHGGRCGAGSPSRQASSPSVGARALSR